MIVVKSISIGVRVAVSVGWMVAVEAGSSVAEGAGDEVPVGVGESGLGACVLQDASSKRKTRIDFFILQLPVSDRSQSICGEGSQQFGVTHLYIV